MKPCPNCGAQLEDRAVFCLTCNYEFHETRDPWLDRIVAGRFRIIEKLGEGGMGSVYRAEQMPMGRIVALKLLHSHLSRDPSQIGRFKREAQVVSQLSHPNTVILHDFGQDGDTLFIAMEELKGKSLASVLKEEGPLPVQRAARILCQICGSLIEAHGQGMIHRDLKPDNIMLIERGGVPDFVKVLDFGIAKMNHSASGEKLETLTQAGAIFGTPQYMSPEQIKSTTIDARSDIYALGVILYEMLTGHLPFQAGTPLEMLTQHLAAQPLPIESTVEDDALPAFEALKKIVFKALSKAPEERQQSVQELLDELMMTVPELALHTATGIMPALHLTSSTMNAVKAPSTKSRTLLTIVITAVVVLAAVAILLFVLRPKAPKPSMQPAENPPAVVVIPAQPAENQEEILGNQVEIPSENPSEIQEPDDVQEPQNSEKPTEEELEAELAAAEAAANSGEEELSEEEAKKLAAQAEKAAAEAEIERQKNEELAKQAAAELLAKNEQEKRLKAAQAAFERMQAEAEHSPEKRLLLKAIQIEQARDEELQARNEVALYERAQAEAEALYKTAETEKATADQVVQRMLAMQAESAAQLLTAANREEAANHKAAVDSMVKKAIEKQSVAEKKLESAQKLASRAQKKLAQSQAKHDSVEARLANLLIEKSEAENQIQNQNSAEDQIIAAQRAKAEAEAENARLQEEAARLQAELQALEEARQEAESLAEEAQKKQEEAYARKDAANNKKKVTSRYTTVHISAKKSKNAKVYINNRFYGTAPINVHLKQGSHTIVLKTKSSSRTKNFTIKDKQPIRLSFDL